MMDNLYLRFRRQFRPMLDVDPNEGGGGTSVVEPPKWAEVFSEETRKDPNFVKDIQKFKAPDELYKSYREAQTKISQKGIIIPTDKSKPEEVAAYRAALGIPEKPDGYKLTTPEKLHKSVVVTPEASKAYMERAHKLGLSNAQANDLNAAFLSDLSQYMEAQETANAEQLKASETALRKEWGAYYDAKFQQAKKVVDAGGKELLEALGDKVNDPRVVKYLSKLGATLSEDVIKTIGGTDTESGGGDLAAQIDKIHKDPKHPYNDDKHQDHHKWVGPDGELRKMYLKLYPNG